MKRKLYNPAARSRRLPVGIKALVALVTLVVASCSADTDNGPGLPDSPRPLQITALAPPSMTVTRSVAGKTEWKGDGTEKIGISADDGQMWTYGRYAIIDKAGNTLTLPGDTALYLRSKDVTQFVAWYPGDADNRIYYDISDQSTPEKLKQVDFLRALERRQGFGDPLRLQFQHVMAKVRIEVLGNHYPQQAEAAIFGYTYTVFAGKNMPFLPPNETYEPYYSSRSYLKACPDPEPGRDGLVAFEILLPPRQTLTDRNIIRLTLDGQVYNYYPNNVTLEAGEVYTYEVSLP